MMTNEFLEIYISIPLGDVAVPEILGNALAARRKTRYKPLVATARKSWAERF
jgi:hypothetical protein